MRYGRKKSSEFGVPRGSTAWRARGPPMAVTEPRMQFLPILSQPHSCPALPGIFSNPSRSDYPAGHCEAVVTPDNMLLCFILHVQAVQPGTGTAYWVTSYCDRCIQWHPVCGSTVTLVYHCIIVWVLDMSVSGQMSAMTRDDCVYRWHSLKRGSPNEFD